MRIRHIVSIAIAAAVIILATATVVRAASAQTSLSPDRILKGAVQIITITDKNIPKEIKSVLVAGQPAIVQDPRVEGKVSVQLPQLDFVGRADVKVIGTDDKLVASGYLTYIDSTEPPPSPTFKSSWAQLIFLCLYIVFIAFVPLFCTFYDIKMSYKERSQVLHQLRPHATNDDIRAILKDMDQGPTGLTGLTRGLLALMLVLALAFAIFHLVVFAPSTKVPDIAEKVLLLLAGTLASITGFYFGSKAVSDAEAKTKESEKVTSKKQATITLSNLEQIHNGSSLSPTATTDPQGLKVDFSYTGTDGKPSSIAPIEKGSYKVVATINDPNYAGTATDTFVIKEMTGR
jgi:hypothetical protein